jgi:hypothetical protein
MDSLRRHVEGQICKLTAQAAGFTDLDGDNGSLNEEVIRITAHYNSSMMIMKSRILRNAFKYQSELSTEDDLNAEHLSNQVSLGYRDK